MKSAVFFDIDGTIWNYDKYIPESAKLAIKKLEAKTGKKCCANVDFYSGLIYELLDIPRDLFIPIFAAARLVGWVSHDIENLLYCNKIVRPATKYVGFKED